MRQPGRERRGWAIAASTSCICVVVLSAGCHAELDTRFLESALIQFPPEHDPDHQAMREALSRLGRNAERLCEYGSVTLDDAESQAADREFEEARWQPPQREPIGQAVRHPNTLLRRTQRYPLAPGWRCGEGASGLAHTDPLWAHLDTQPSVRRGHLLCYRSTADRRRFFASVSGVVAATGDKVKYCTSGYCDPPRKPLRCQKRSRIAVDVLLAPSPDTPCEQVHDDGRRDGYSRSRHR